MTEREPPALESVLLEQVLATRQALQLLAAHTGLTLELPDLPATATRALRPVDLNTSTPRLATTDWVTAALGATARARLEHVHREGPPGNGLTIALQLPTTATTRTVERDDAGNIARIIETPNAAPTA